MNIENMGPRITRWSITQNYPIQASTNQESNICFTICKTEKPVDKDIGNLILGTSFHHPSKTSLRAAFLEDQMSSREDLVD